MHFIKQLGHAVCRNRLVALLASGMLSLTLFFAVQTPVAPMIGPSDGPVVACGFARANIDENRRRHVENLIKNSGFESGSATEATGWSTRIWSGEPAFGLETEFGFRGKRCMRIQSTTGADASWSQRVEVKRNTDYRVSVWVKTDQLEGGGFGAQLNLHELQMEGKTAAIQGTSEWTQLSSEFNSGPHNRLLLNLLFGGWGRATGTAWFDEVELVELEPMPTEPPMDAEQAADMFEQHILPMLKKNCFECHGGGGKIRAELVLTNREDMLAGGESGPAIDLESPLESILLSAIEYEDYEMPPSGKLPESDIERVRKWIQAGAPWKGEQTKPSAEAAEGHSVPEVNAETKQWWAYQPPRRSEPPKANTDWTRNPIDQFVWSKLNEQGLEPNPPATKQTLIRRVYYDLIGLPPTPKEVDAFVHDASEDAYETMVDRLLASEHYGEKWGRHWLDLVRYGESNSYERDGTKPFVWRYRDYVIRAFNENKPYDQFLIEQLAGDELPGENPDALIATGFYRLGKWDDEPVDPEQAWFDDADDILATLSQAFLGMTVNCARCHDHKIDPIPQSDYYRMLAFVRNIQRYGVRSYESVLQQSTRPIVSAAVQKQHDAEVQAYRRQVDQNRKELEEIERWVKKDFIPVEHEEFVHDMNRVPLVKKRVDRVIDGEKLTAEVAERYENLFKEMKRLRNEKPKRLQAALCVTEKGREAPETHVLIRGNSKARGEVVQPGFPLVLSPPSPEIEPPTNGKSTGRRLALARWIASKENPLTARVMVNRIWQHHFGRGIVRSTNDFGFQSTPPTHPQLLDWLATQFMDSGWDVKQMHRTMMLSSTYRMSSESRAKPLADDPLNDLFWRFNMRRLTAEEVRDSVLAVNGTLAKEKMFGPSIYPTIPDEVLQGQSRPGENWHTSSPEQQARRSVYIHIKRSLPVPLLASFDAADPDSSCPVRFNTVQPTQALGMLNSQFLNDEASKFAERIKKMAGDQRVDQIATILRLVTQREPNESEIERGVAFVNAQAKVVDSEQALQLFCVVALNLNEFIYLD